MRLIQNMFVKIFGLSSLAVITPIQCAEIEPFGMTLLRYEHESSFNENVADRQRVRLIVHGGFKVQIDDTWSAVGRLSTGLKNKQNVPALTIKRFSDQPQPDNDIYVDQAYLQFKKPSFAIKVGRVPWSFNAATDTFWDRNLHPYTIHFARNIDKEQSFNAAYIKPLDGQYHSVGNMFVMQYKNMQLHRGITWEFQPWVVVYEGEANARFADRDTALDHRSVRLMLSATFQTWRLGMDLGNAFTNHEATDVLQNGLSEGKSIVTELRKGRLKLAKDWQWHIRYMHVERHSVIAEFAQNAISAKLTSNFKGWDARFRYLVRPNMWVGTRLSMVKSISGAYTKSNRFRIEARWGF